MSNTVEINGVDVEFIEDNNTMFCTSLDIAKVFEKQHKNVLRDIKNILNNLEEIGDFQCKLNFEPTHRDTEIKGFSKVQGKIRKDFCYNLTRDGFSLLAMGFTGTKALKFKVAFIEAFNQLEDITKNSGKKLELANKTSNHLVELLDIKNEKIAELEAEVKYLQRFEAEDLYLEFITRAKYLANNLQENAKGNSFKIMKDIFSMVCDEFGISDDCRHCKPYILKSNPKYIKHALKLCEKIAKKENVYFPNRSK